MEEIVSNYRVSNIRLDEMETEDFSSILMSQGNEKEMKRRRIYRDCRCGIVFSSMMMSFCDCQRDWCGVLKKICKVYVRFK
jgi:hypothetical protein